ncbi:haloalkane dehalogenase protein [Halorhabdus tiamatea SARL4B]|uniref:Alpha/beta hydrolase fold protein n=1 Tax=Halorhabdus tiamatea SARL4B TaxID=1033806 RepID=F7PPW0_9EURY|nr:alpha/beta hydrolase [Halorhabdus tiamatea]ERJ05001.1 haloalkane dehalogenase protein [Halorhabdus tiamatea SARL4B]CCQ32426.1 alpha/beta hydrolase fold protein [Halorhabdus tiamatea SARL4B]
MKLRNLLTAAVGAAGVTAGVNRLLTARAGDLEPPLVGASGTYRWRGFDVAYTEAGDPDDPDLLLIHGLSAASSSREFAEVFEDLSREYHVIAPDLPGFGRSDRPPLLYSASLYETFLRDAIRGLVDEPRVVASSLSGAYAASAAAEADVDSLVLIAPTDSTMSDSPRSWLRSLFRTPLLGTGLFNLLVSKSGIKYFHRDHGYADMDNLTAETLSYQWKTAHQPGARYAPASFVSGYLDPASELTETLADVDAPVTLVWGRDADITPVSGGRALAKKTDSRLIVFDDAKLLPHVEHPAAFVGVVTDDFDEAPSTPVSTS